MNLFNVYQQYEIEPVRGAGSYLIDKKGVKYLDFYGGHAVISIGHSHPHYIKRVKKQLDKLGFYSNAVKNSLSADLADKLGKISGYQSYNLFLCNSGAEANENAMKLASFINGRKKIISFKNSFHGRTSLAVDVTDNPKIKPAINISGNNVILPLNDTEALEYNMHKPGICAVIIEGVQGIGGINVPDSPFLEKIYELCHEKGALMIADEIQSGYGRTGKFFAHQYSSIRPDIITIAKGMGNGFPVAGVLIHPDIKANYGMLGTTFGGNHLACAAAIAVIEVIKKEKLIRNAHNTGKYIIKHLKDIKGIKEIRGRGLMIGIEFEKGAEPINNLLLQRFKVFTGLSSDKKTLRILPPLNITKKEARIFLESLKEVIALTSDSEVSA
jgi:acetylornithine/N-succinyldiaminopimelate aminotransferase